MGVEVDKVPSKFEPGGPDVLPLNGHSLPIRELRLTSAGSSASDKSAEVDWETTRHLAAATQLDLRYARLVVRKIIGEPFRVVAPAAGADVVVVTRWALAALRRRAQRDAALTCLLIFGSVTALIAWTWIPLAVVTALAVLVVAQERWVRDVKVITRLMLRGRFRARDAPSSPSPRIEERLAVVKEQQNGNLVVFRGQSAFVGSGQRVLHDRILVNVALGKRGKNGKRQQPIPFSNPELHAALETALKGMDFPELRVCERLFVNGEHVAGNSRLLPNPLGPPVASAPPNLLYNGCLHPTPEARTYLCAEIGGWKGQLVVSLFARAVQARGSLQVEWTFHLLPPLHDNLLQIDHWFERRRIRQLANAVGTGFIWSIPSLILAPVNFVRHAAGPLIDKLHIKKQSFAIRNGYVFNYGSLRSIREDPISYKVPHYFLAQDQLTFILLAEHTMIRALGRFLKAHKVDMKQFTSQEETFINKVKNYNVDEINAHNVSVGNKSRAGDSKGSASSSGK